MNTIKFIAGLLGLFIALSCSGQEAIPSGNSGRGSQGAQLRFPQMERSVRKFDIPVAKKKVPTRDEWVMEFAPLEVILDSLDIGIDSFPTDLTFAEKQNDSIRLNNSSGSDVWFLEGDGIELERIDSTRMRIHDIKGNYSSLTTVGWADAGTYFGGVWSYYFILLDYNIWTKFDFKEELNYGTYTNANASSDTITILKDALYDVSYFATVVPQFYTTRAAMYISLMVDIPATGVEQLSGTGSTWNFVGDHIPIALRSQVYLPASTKIWITKKWLRLDAVNSGDEYFTLYSPNFIVQRLR